MRHRLCAGVIERHGMASMATLVTFSSFD